MVLKLDIKSFNFIFFIFNYLFFFACFNCAIKPGIYYEVKKNESLRDISERYNIPLKAIYRTNEKKVLENIKEGTKIFLPGIKSLKEENKTKEKISIVKKSEEIKTTKSNKKKVKENVEIKKNIENNERDIIINNKKIEFKKPIEGKIIGYFGIRKDYVNRGIDIESKENSEIKAAADGKVIFAGSIDNYGKVIFIKHKFDYITVYANNAEIYVKEDEFVQEGKVIARIGYHPKYNKYILHFEIRKIKENNKVEILDPLNFLEDYKK